MRTVEAARAQFAALCDAVGSCAILVLDDRDAASAEYYDWLCGQTRQEEE